MGEYQIRYSSVAVENLHNALMWGAENWGEEAAGRWLDELEKHIRDRLTLMPKAYPIAPESHEFELEIRNLICGRYRILYSVTVDEVLLLYVRGPYSGGSSNRVSESNSILND